MEASADSAMTSSTAVVEAAAATEASNTSEVTPLISSVTPDQVNSNATASIPDVTAAVATAATPTIDIVVPLSEDATSPTAAATPAEATTIATTAAAEASSTPTAPVSPPRTETATATAAGSPPHTIMRGEDILLRDWNMNATATAPGTQEATATGMMPPVAPAVVLNETSEGSINSTTPRVYSYPVATFVSNFVRTSVNEIRDHMTNHIYAAAVPETVEEGEMTITSASNDPLSIRSEPAGVVAATATTSAAPMSRSLNISHSVPSLEDDDGGTEFLLIDGDLVAIPTIPDQPSSHTMDDTESDISSYSRSRQRHSFSQYPLHARPYNSNNNRNHIGTMFSQQATAHSGSDEQHSEDFLDPRNVSYSRGDSSHGGYSHRSQLSQDQHQAQGIVDQNKTGQLEMGDEDDDHSQYTRSTGSLNRNACRPNHSRMHRGVRKVKKWMKKKNLLPRRNKHSQNPYHQPLPPHGVHPAMADRKLGQGSAASSTLGDEDYSRDDNSTIASSQATPSIQHQQQALHQYQQPPQMDDDSIATTTEEAPVASPNRRKHKRKKNLLGRLKDHGEAKVPPATSDGSGHFTTSSTSVASDTSRMGPPAAAVSSLHAPPAAAAASLGGVTSVDPLLSSPAAAAAATMSIPEPPQSAAAYQGMSSMGSLAFPPAAAAATSTSLDLSSPYATATTEASASLLDASAEEMPSLNGSSSFHRQASIAAEYVGSADQLMQAGVLPESILAAEAYIEDRLDDYDKYDKKDSYYLRSMVPRDADFKVDKLDAPCVDMMLRRAGEIAAEDVEGSDAPLVAEAHSFLGATKGKSDGESVPLSMATGGDTLVHNDILKLVMVGDARVDKSALARALRKSSKKPRKRTTLGVDVHSWTPANDDNVRFTIWDVQGAASTEVYDSNFGAHPGTQSLFFSDRSLYLLVWDLAASNRKTYRRKVLVNDEDSDEEDEEDHNEYLREEANRQADRALQADIEDRVLSWVDCIARRGSHSAILPIALVESAMEPSEAKHRCDMMQTMMMQHTLKLEQEEGVEAPKVLSGAETVLCVSLDTNMGMQLLEETILAIATDASHSVFDHVGTPVPMGTTQILETCRRLKNDHKLVLVDHLMTELMPLKGEMGLMLTEEQVMEALHFLACIGEVLYFGGMDDILNHYVILSRKWMVSALSCILRNDLKRELMETRRFMNMQCLYSDQRFPENHVTQTFSANTSNCPLLSSTDTQMLWQSMSFMREAADKSSQSEDHSITTNSTMFGFLEHLLVHTGVFLPLDIDRFASPDMVYFVPSLLAQDTSRDIWTYKSSDSWMTTLAHSWLFRDGTPSGLMEHVTVALLRDLYEFSHIVASAGPHSPPPRSQTFPFAQNSLTDFLNDHDGDQIGHIKIHQMMCWKHSLLVKIGCVFPDGNELRESFAEIFVSIADPSANHCVASDAMRSNMQRLIVSGKGQVGHHGRKLWKGGYSLVLDSIKASVASCTNVDRQVICPECLAHVHPSSASTWSWDSVRAAAETGSAIVRCMRGHRVESNLICGTTKAAAPKNDGLHSLAGAPKKPVKDMLPSVVLVGLWDCKTNTVRNVGSGFIVDKKQGLIVTAGHILFEMEEGRNFGTPYFGLKDAKVVIGTVPEATASSEQGVASANPGGANGAAASGSSGTKPNNTASFRYFAEIVADDIHSMDACVLRITTRLEQDVDDDAQLGQQPERVVNPQDEQLPVLKMTKRFELEETVRILGFNQAGEGWLEQGKHVNRSADFARGYICKHFKTADDGSESDSDDSSSSCGGFAPREEIVIMCPTIPGHSGGPCVNEEGRVVGILSRADPVDRTRCYLVPSSELRVLVNKARKSSSRVGGPKPIY